MKSIGTLNSIIKAPHSILSNLIEMDTQPYGGSVTTYRFCTGWYPLVWNGNTYIASGNIIQICPVGALTSASYRFRSRPFDLVSVASVAEHDASGSAIRIDYRRGEVLRRLAGERQRRDEARI